MDEARYRQLVGNQAVTFEQRLHDAGARFFLTAIMSGWRAELSLLTPPTVFAAEAPMLSTALWLAARKAGLTEGLDPPAKEAPSSSKRWTVHCKNGDITDGLTEDEARSEAQRLANEQNEAVHLWDPNAGMFEKIEPRATP